MGTIVVGVDGSEGSLAALRFAIEEARIRGTEVRAVNAWHVPPAVYGGGWAPAGVDFDEFRKLAEAALEKTLEDVGAREAGVLRSRRSSGKGSRQTSCARKLRIADDLLVVGSRGLGGFRGLLLGSVSQQAVHHSACPVVVVPPSRSEGRERTAELMTQPDLEATSPERMRRLVEVGISLSSELSLEALLRRLIETAVELTDARYGALGVIDRLGTGLEQFITVGIDAETQATIGDLPHGRGILGVLIRERSALRLDDLSQDPRSVGIPARAPADAVVPRRADHAAGHRVRKPVPDGEGRRARRSPRSTRRSSACSPRRPRSRSRTPGSTRRRGSGRGSSSR